MSPAQPVDPWKISIDKITELAPTNVGGVVQKQLQLTYHVGANGPFSLVFTFEAWNPQQIQSFLVEQQAKLKKLYESVA